MKRLFPTLAATVLVSLAFAAPATADFGINGFDVTFTKQDPASPSPLEPATQAGSHPFAVTTVFDLNTKLDPESGTEVPDETVKETVFHLPPGFVGDPGAVPYCSSADFFKIKEAHNACPNRAAIGVAAVQIFRPGFYLSTPVYSLPPAPGIPSRFGFTALTVPIVIDAGVSPQPPYELATAVPSIPQVLPFFGTQLTLWGNPSDPAHDPYRGSCLFVRFSAGAPKFTSNGNCPTSNVEEPFLTLPRSCTGPAMSTYAASSWQNPGGLLPDGEPDLTDPAWVTGYALTHDGAEPPNPQGFTGCGRLGFNPTINAKPTTLAADSPTGLDFSLDVADEGLTNPKGIADSDIRKAEVTLPEGFTTNPSLAEGLNVCTKADLQRETVASAPGEGCPNESKIGSVELESPLIEESLTGSLYIAEPYQNPAHGLLGLYLVVKNRELGIIVKQFLKVQTDPRTGQITTVGEDLPQLPFSHFKLHFREGARSPLISPPACGEYSAKAVLTPWSGGEPIETTSAFQIVSGADNTPCPTAATPPFHPELLAGTLNNAAGTYSPFDVRLDRRDGEQEITHFSIKLPPGVSGKLAGIPECPDAAIAAAKARTGPQGGAEELADPSCPAASEVGHSLVGAGVGSALTYAPGKMYLAGPYHGSNLSLVSITAAKVGPFDLGTVVVRFALKIDPETAEVSVDGRTSDPIPHIIQGIPVHLRDIRAYVDRPEFTLNPTSCKKTSTASTVLGSGLNFASEADDQPITVTSPFQTADCAALAFKPKLALSLKGSTKRGGTPAFKAVLTYPKGGSYANVARARVTLPHSEFLDNAHIGTVCTRVQFAQGTVPGEKCPPASVYGYAKAITPILSEPLQGPVYLRSSEHQLPDLVAALHNAQADIALDGHVEGVNGGIRNTFEAVPDAPVSKFTLEMQGGKKGLLENSTNLCLGAHRAEADFTGQNGKISNTKPVLAVKCAKVRKKGKGHHKRPGR